jgi:hypothetical protein
MEKFSASLIIREMQIETTMRYQVILVRMAIIKNTKDTKCLWRIWRRGNPCSVGGNVFLLSHGKQYGDSSKIYN